MDFIISFLTQYGYWGMLLAAFLAGSFFPFSSEAVLVGLIWERWSGLRNICM